MHDATLYQEILMDHYRYPRNCGSLSRADFSSGSFNPSCGDSVAFSGLIVAGILADVKFLGKGCVISQAAASLLTEQVKHTQLSTIVLMTANHMQTLIGMQLGPTRLRCALLPLEALHKGIEEYAQSHQSA